MNDHDRAPKRAQIKGRAEPPFDQRLWTPERFRTRINAVLDDKQAKYERKPAVFDVLVIHHEHGWLNAELARGWLAEGTFESRSCLRNAHLLLSYEPRGSNHRPLYRLYGEL